jgi:hypothetical protein
VLDHRAATTGLAWSEPAISRHAVVRTSDIAAAAVRPAAKLARVASRCAASRSDVTSRAVPTSRLGPGRRRAAHLRAGVGQPALQLLHRSRDQRQRGPELMADVGKGHGLGAVQLGQLFRAAVPVLIAAGARDAGGQVPDD